MPVVTYRLRSSRKEFWIISNTWRCRAGHSGARQGKVWLGLTTAYKIFHEGFVRWGGVGRGVVGLCLARRADVWRGLATAYSGFYEASVRCGTARWGGVGHGMDGSCRAGSGAAWFGKVWAGNSG